MKNPVMLYKFPGHPKKGMTIERKIYDVLVVEAECVEQTVANGWYETPEEARLGGQEKPVDPEEQLRLERSKLEAKARSLGVSFNKATKDEVLIDRIELAELDKKVGD